MNNSSVFEFHNCSPLLFFSLISLWWMKYPDVRQGGETLWRRLHAFPFEAHRRLGADTDYDTHELNGQGLGQLRRHARARQSGAFRHPGHSHLGGRIQKVILTFNHRGGGGVLIQGGGTQQGVGCQGDFDFGGGLQKN